MAAKMQNLRIGAEAPEFFVETAEGRISLGQLAARHEKLVVTTQDSYRYHPN